MSEPYIDGDRTEAERRPDVAGDERDSIEVIRLRLEAESLRAEAVRAEAEQVRVDAEAAREVREQAREELETLRQDQETRRELAEGARIAAEDARHATIGSVASTAEALNRSLAQMQFLQSARETLRVLQSKPEDPD